MENSKACYIFQEKANNSDNDKENMYHRGMDTVHKKDSSFAFLDGVRNDYDSSIKKKNSPLEHRRPNNRTGIFV